MQLDLKPGCDSQSIDRPVDQGASGLLIVNADDWGRDRINTDRTLECVRAGTVSSVSAMVFMEDSERAAVKARELGIDAGIHLNFTAPFSGADVPDQLFEHQQRIGRYLLRNRFSQVMFHPGLAQSFEYVVAHQLAEFLRLYGSEPQRIDGHHHMHLCANVVLGKLMPEGVIVRRNFSFGAGEKSRANRLYRKWLDEKLAKRHRLVDYFFCIEPLEPVDRLRHIFSYAHQFLVEIETHPVNPEEYKFLLGGEIFRRCCGIEIASRFAVPKRTHAANRAQTRQVAPGSAAYGHTEAGNGDQKAVSLIPIQYRSDPQGSLRATVLVGFAEAASAAEVVWSLIDAGFQVIAFSRKGHPSALRHSRHVVCHEICAPEEDLQASISDLRLLLASVESNASGAYRILFPLDDKAVLLCCGVELHQGWLLAGPDGTHAELALNKNVQIQAAAASGFNVPKTAFIRTANDIRNFVAAESYPIILKSANCIAIEDGRAKTFPQWICADDAELERALREWDERTPLLAQPFIMGTGEGIFGLAAPDGIRAWSAHRRLRMMNPKGSGSSACISQPVSQDLRCKAEDFVRRTGWQGMFMIELLRDRSGAPFFVEFNGRPWGSMALSRRQNLEYPAWQAMLAVDAKSPVGRTTSPAPGIVSRHLGRELTHLLFVLRGPKSKALTEWPSLRKSVWDVIRLRRADTLYNWRREDMKVFLADIYYTIKSNVFKSSR